jgi:hypothetical protein
MATEKKFITNDSRDQVSRYIDEICSDPGFLCSNRDLCGSSTTIYTSPDNVNKICNDIKTSNVCEDDFSECLVNVPNMLDDSHEMVSTSFVNIIIPILGAFDQNANQKFLRLPSLSASKKPKSEDICHVCACMNRFATSPGASNTIGEASYTSPGQNTCIYPEFIENYYYPIEVENINSKLKERAPPVKLGKYTIINSNIIYAHSEEELIVQNLYDLLVKNGISESISKRFIIEVLYRHDVNKSKELDLYISEKSDIDQKSIKQGKFYQHISFFYISLIIFIAILIFKIV